MIKDINFNSLEVVSSTKNITDLVEYKTVTIAITLVKTDEKYFSYEGIEKLIKDTELSENKKFIKLSCTYSTNEKNQVLLPVKIAFNPGNTGTGEKYSKRYYYESELEVSTFEDLKFIEDFFERTPVELKRLYM